AGRRSRPPPRPRATAGWAWRGAARRPAARHQAGRTAAVLPGRRPGTAPTTARSTVVLQVLEERVVALQHDRRVAAGEGLAVCLQAAMEGVEGRIAAVGPGINPRRLGIALAAQLLRVALGLGQDHGLLPVGLRTDLL